MSWLPKAEKDTITFEYPLLTQAMELSIDDRSMSIDIRPGATDGSDKWAHDTNRQRILERAGWVFWRYFASTWTFRKDKAVYELVWVAEHDGNRAAWCARTYQHDGGEARLASPIEDFIVSTPDTEGVQAGLL